MITGLGNFVGPVYAFLSEVACCVRLRGGAFNANPT